MVFVEKKPKNIYVGKETTNKIVDFLLVGGGGGSGAGWYFGGGGGGGVKYYECEELANGTYCVVIGCGGTKGGGTSSNGCSTCFGDYIVHGGGGGGGNGVCSGCLATGGGNNYPFYCSSPFRGVTCYPDEGYNGGLGWEQCFGYQSSGGGGGAGGSGKNAPCLCYGGDGGEGFVSDIEGEVHDYGGGGGGAGACYPSNGGGTSGGHSGAANCDVATGGCYYGGGGGGGCCCSGGGGTCGCQGVFILRYPTSCGYNITGGTKYTCNGYTIHKFTGDGNLVIN